MTGLPIVQGLTPCPAEVMVLAHELSAAIEARWLEANLKDRVAMEAAYAAVYVADDMLYAAGWHLGGPTRNVPGGALTWVVERVAP